MYKGRGQGYLNVNKVDFRIFGATGWINDLPSESDNSTGSIFVFFDFLEASNVLSRFPLPPFLPLFLPRTAEFLKGWPPRSDCSGPTCILRIEMIVRNMEKGEDSCTMLLLGEEATGNDVTEDGCGC
ncbi:hypothetical protein HAX54_052190 [Datura stramonium]|uniref:Uncharacterized protein n=1 Tax=Datura stramonium TaxID=4076 RepID=A0ABS8WS70_DATST|nr:hypothetical protein [Datura stramonium]